MRERPIILIIDDDREILRGLAIRLRAAGCDVISAPDGESGIARAAASAPDLCTLDVQMPGMDGLEVLAVLKARPETAAIPVVVLSANVVETTRARALSLGAACFLQKPCPIEHIVSLAMEAASAARDLPASSDAD